MPVQIQIQRKRNMFIRGLVAALISLQVLAPLTLAGPPKLSPEYDAGPNPNDPMGRALIDLNSEIPPFDTVSTAVMGTQKFRPAYGPIPWRMLQKPNSVKILFIGQDGTHIAEAAERPATAGFGGRAQDLAAYFGVGRGAAFINTYAFTIKGQHGTRDQAVVLNSSAQPKVSYQSFVPNDLWLMSMDNDSPIVKWRNNLIEWIIRNNSKSLKMIVTFGGAARDAASAFVISKGGVVSPNFKGDLANVRVPLSTIVNTGGNGESSVPLTPEGRDLFAEILGKTTPNYNTDENGGDGPDMKAAKSALSSQPQWLKRLALVNGGAKGSGILTAAQLGGYDLDNGMIVTPGGSPSLSLKGLRISNDLVIDHDLLVVQLPHPTYLSNKTKDQAAELVAGALQDVKARYAKSASRPDGWVIDADPGLTNQFAAGVPYEYGRTDIGPEFYDFGAPASRMVSVSSAVRLDRNTVVFGTRDKDPFVRPDPKSPYRKIPVAEIDSMKAEMPAQLPPENEMWNARPRTPELRYTFDPGPGEVMANLMKSSLPLELVKAKAENGDYAHYRGTFQSPMVVILADPSGYDDLISARALTGTRGQFLHGLMDDMGVGTQYLVLKTAPFAKEADWENVLAQTRAYREAVLGTVLAQTQPVAILADGPDALSEAKRIVSKKLPVIEIPRTSSDHSRDSSDMVAAGAALAKLPTFAGHHAQGRRADIPRVHLSYYARHWIGTSGDRVICKPYTEKASHRNVTACAEVVPLWVTKQRFPLPAKDADAVATLKAKLVKAGLKPAGAEGEGESDDKDHSDND